MDQKPANQCDMPAGVIAKLCRAAENAAQRIRETYSDNSIRLDGDELPHDGCAKTTEAVYERAWDEMLEFAARLSLAPAHTQRDILSKVKIFRYVNHEPEAAPTVEEQLLASILDDMERLEENETPLKRVQAQR